jgi:hypothetical protein
MEHCGIQKVWHRAMRKTPGKTTVAAIGARSSEPREYAVRPILFSGTGKRETSEKHAQMIRTILEACRRQRTRNNLTYPTICIASDGESKRSDALVILTMTSHLSEHSPIYAQLQPLELMNLLVGPDDITADKDFKRVIKRQLYRQPNLNPTFFIQLVYNRNNNNHTTSLSLVCA